jgi:acyl phosphate:glycerol-3-phosphate acyltransferase
MNTFYIALSIILAYLLGSIPTAVWVGKTFFKLDIRTRGSGNAGATNVIRVFGWKAGVPVLLFDMFKAWAAVKLPYWLPVGLEGEVLINFSILLGVIAVLGHVFPVFAGFKGGKGVASLAGMLVGLYPEAFFPVLAIFLLVFILSGYVSLGSIIASAFFPVIVIFVFSAQSITLIIFSILVAIAVPVLHAKNIKRLKAGTETKIRFRK